MGQRKTLTFLDAFLAGEAPSSGYTNICIKYNLKCCFYKQSVQK